MRRAIVIGAALLALAACGGDDSDSGPTAVEATDAPSTTTAATTTAITVTTAATTTAAADVATTTEPPTTTTAAAAGLLPKDFLAELFSYNVARMEALRSAVAPGSLAAAYLEFQIGGTAASTDSGQPVTPSSVRADGDAVDVCADDGSCTSYADFTSVDGLLSGFTVGGNDIAARLAAPGEPVVSQLATVRLLSAYRTVSSDAMCAVLEITATGPTISVYGYSATYVDPTGRQISTSYQVGPSELNGGARALTEICFASADVGGIVHLDGAETTNTWEVQVPVVPLG